MNLGLLHQKYHFQRLDKKSDFYQLVKNNFWGACQNYYNFTQGGYGQTITVLYRGEYAQMITILHRGVSWTPKSDYVICARPLRRNKRRVPHHRIHSTIMTLLSFVQHSSPPTPFFSFFPSHCFVYLDHSLYIHLLISSLYLFISLSLSCTASFFLYLCH